jgi:predicted transcriptional regulator
VAAEKSNLLSTGAIAKELGISGPAVSKAIKTLNLKPEMKKGVCSYYSKEAVKNIKAHIKNL